MVQLPDGWERKASFDPTLNLASMIGGAAKRSAEKRSALVEQSPAGEPPRQWRSGWRVMRSQLRDVNRQDPKGFWLICFWLIALVITLILSPCFPSLSIGFLAGFPAPGSAPGSGSRPYFR